MKDKPANPQAFPVQTHEQDGQGNYINYQNDGMTLRDYFAAKAMQSQISNQKHMRNYNNEADGEDSVIVGWVAESSYEIADAMLAERSKSDE